MRHLAIFGVMLSVILAWGCEDQLVEPGSPAAGAPETAGKPGAKVAYTLDFSGDIVAAGVPAKADPNALWSTMEVTGTASVTLPEQLASYPQYFHEVHPDPTVDYTQPNLSWNPPFCTYTEKDAEIPRLNSWGDNARTWTNTKITLTPPPPGRVGFSLNLDSPPSTKNLPPGTYVLKVVARDSDPELLGNVLKFTKSQALVGIAPTALSIHSDPCVSFQIVATLKP